MWSWWLCPEVCTAGLQQPKRQWYESLSEFKLKEEQIKSVPSNVYLVLSETLLLGIMLCTEEIKRGDCQRHSIFQQAWKVQSLQSLRYLGQHPESSIRVRAPADNFNGVLVVSNETAVHTELIHLQQDKHPGSGWRGLRVILTDFTDSQCLRFQRFSDTSWI